MELASSQRGARWPAAESWRDGHAAVRQELRVAVDRGCYFHAFADGNGVPLNGSANNYVLTFQLGQQPDVQRFWSLTAYVPVTIELGTHSGGKYVVASYTTHLVTAPDGSVSVVMAVKKPAGVPKANWLPIPNGPFSLMLRAYGPNWNQQTNPYTPPPIQVLP